MGSLAETVPALPSAHKLKGMQVVVGRNGVLPDIPGHSATVASRFKDTHIPGALLCAQGSMVRPRPAASCG